MHLQEGRRPRPPQHPPPGFRGKGPGGDDPEAPPNKRPRPDEDVADPPKVSIDVKAEHKDEEKQDDQDEFEEESEHEDVLIEDPPDGTVKDENGKARPKRMPKKGGKGGAEGKCGAGVEVAPPPKTSGPQYVPPPKREIWKWVPASGCCDKGWCCMAACGCI